MGRGPGLVSRCSLFPNSMASGRHPMSLPLPPSSHLHCSEWSTASGLPHLELASCCTQAPPNGVGIPGGRTHVEVRETPSASLTVRTSPSGPSRSRQRCTPEGTGLGPHVCCPPVHSTHPCFPSRPANVKMSHASPHVLILNVILLRVLNRQEKRVKQSKLDKGLERHRLETFRCLCAH